MPRTSPTAYDDTSRTEVNHGRIAKQKGFDTVKITVGSDHGAVELKEEIKIILKGMGIEVKDVGTFSKESVDYPDIAELVCADVVGGHADRGIVLCGTGIGISIAANKIHGIRCALCGDVYSARMSRQHNDANVLALGGRVLGFGPAREIVRAWVKENFAGERHARRVGKIMDLEKKQ